MVAFDMKMINIIMKAAKQSGVSDFHGLGLCYLEFGMMNHSIGYIEKTKKITTRKFEVPELYIGGKNIPNGNTPLAWSVSLSYLFLSKMENIEVNK